MEWQPGLLEDPFYPRVCAFCFHLSVVGHAVFEQTCVGVLKMNFAEAEC